MKIELKKILNLLKFHLLIAQPIVFKPNEKRLSKIKF